MHLSMTRVDALTTVLDEDSGRILGYIQNSGYGYFVLDIRPLDGAAVPIIADTYAAAVDTFERLTHNDPAEEAPAGDVNTVQATFTVYVEDGSQVTSFMVLTKDNDNNAEWSVLTKLSFGELRQLAGVVNFALARMAVTR